MGHFLLKNGISNIFSQKTFYISIFCIILEMIRTVRWVEMMRRVQDRCI